MLFLFMFDISASGAGSVCLSIFKVNLAPEPKYFPTTTLARWKHYHSGLTIMCEIFLGDICASYFCCPLYNNLFIFYFSNFLFLYMSYRLSLCLLESVVVSVDVCELMLIYFHLFSQNWLFVSHIQCQIITLSASLLKTEISFCFFRKPWTFCIKLSSA